MTDGFKDNRSPLAKTLAAGVPWKRVRAERGRLAGVKLAVRFLPWFSVENAQLAALTFLTEGREGAKWQESHLYTELGEATLDVETQARVLAEGLIVAPDHDDAELTEGTCVRAARDADDLRKILTADEIGFLYTEFVRFDRECSPITRAAAPEEVEAFIDALGKGTMPVSRLRTCAPDSLLAIATSLAVKYVLRTSEPSSPGSPSSDTSDGSATPSDSDPSGETPTTGITIEIQPPR